MENIDFNTLLKKYQSCTCTLEERQLIEYHILLEHITPNSISKTEAEHELGEVAHILMKLRSSDHLPPK